MTKRIKTELYILFASALLLAAYVAAEAYINRSRVISDENLRSFYELIKADPLFYDPATEAAFLRDSVQELKNLDDVILLVDKLYREKQGGQYRDVFPTGWRLWPDEFLASLPYIHEITADFLADPDAAKAEDLLVGYGLAVKSYKKAIDLHVQTMKNIFIKTPRVSKNKILFLGSATTPEIVLSDFLLIQKNAEALEKEVKRREKCLYYGECQSSHFGGQRLTIANPVVKLPFKPLPFDILGIASQSRVVGPYWAETSCFGWSSNRTPFSLPFYLEKIPLEDKGRFLLKPLLTNTKYYRDYTLIPESQEAKLALSKGIKIRMHYETNDYLCTDLTYLANLFSQYIKQEKEGLAVLPYLIQNTLRFSWYPIYNPIYTKKPQSPLYLLVNRSAYSVYFGSFTSAIWRIEERPQFLLKQTFSYRAGYVSYEDLIRKGFADEEIAKFNVSQQLRQVYKNAIRGND